MRTKGDLIPLISVIFILLVYGVPVYATTVVDAGIAAIADKISLSIKTEIVAEKLKQKKQDIIDKVETELKSLSIDETVIKNIRDSLNDLLTSTDNVDAIAVTIKTTITDMLKQNAGIDKKFEKIDERIKNLEAAKQPKMLAPHKDVDFLFEDVIGDTYDAADKENLIVDNKKIKKIKITRDCSEKTCN